MDLDGSSEAPTQEPCATRVTGVRTGGIRKCRGQPVKGELDGNPGRRPKDRATTAFTRFPLTPTTSHTSENKASSDGSARKISRKEMCAGLGFTAMKSYQNRDEVPMVEACGRYKLLKEENTTCVLSVQRITPLRCRL